MSIKTDIVQCTTCEDLGWKDVLDEAGELIDAVPCPDCNQPQVCSKEYYLDPVHITD